MSDSSFYQETQTAVSLHIAGVFPLDARFPGALRSRARPLFLEDGLCAGTVLSEAGSAPQALCLSRPPAVRALRSRLRLTPAARRVPAPGTPASSESVRA